jgi:hypothetical protein
MDNGTQYSLTLVRLPQGGYLVQDPYRRDEFCQQHLACTTIDEALKFMRDKILPIGPQCPQDTTEPSNG